MVISSAVSWCSSRELMLGEAKSMSPRMSRLFFE